MGAAVFLAVWVVLGLGVFLIALRGGPRAAREALHTQTRGGRVAVLAVAAIVAVGFGIVIPTLVLNSNGVSRAKAAPGDVRLTPAQQHGRYEFSLKCATCHTLRAANAVAQVGPNLDVLRPPEALVLDAIANGRARGNGQMPAQLLEGRDAQDVASFVAAVAGH